MSEYNGEMINSLGDKINKFTVKFTRVSTLFCTNHNTLYFNQSFWSVDINISMDPKLNAPGSIVYFPFLKPWLFV